MTTEYKIKNVIKSIEKELLEKNEKYGNSALKPIGIFSKLDSSNSICIRLDDKLSRVKNSKELRKNDTFDLIGYLVLLACDKEWLDFNDQQD